MSASGASGLRAFVPIRWLRWALQSGYVVHVVCKGDCEAHVRALLLQGLNTGGIHLRRLDSSNIENSDRVEVFAVLSADRRSDSVLEQIVGRLSLEPSVTAARWRIEAVME